MVNFLTRSFDSRHVLAAESLLKDGLSLSAGDKLVLLCQNELTEIARCISAVAKKRKVVVELRNFDVRAFSSDYPASFSVSDLSIPPIPSGIVLLIEWSEKSTKARLALLRDLVNVHKGWRIASMPGIDPDNFGLCVSDFTDIRDKCDKTFALLARSKMATLETENPAGAQDLLHIPIGSYRPQNSTGKIGRDAWGNFPSGETFIVPNPYQAQGWVTVRGSIPKRPLEPGEWIRYQLRDGRIVLESIHANSNELFEQFKSLCFDANGNPKDENTNALAELGIGTNSKVTRLTGNPIFDEKKLGTIHIAFGRNDQFKGPLISSVHHDIVCIGATLAVEDVLGTSIALVRNGTFIATWANALREVGAFPEFTQKSSLLTLGKTEHNFQLPEPTGQSLLRMTIEYVSERENVQFVIAEGERAELAHVILHAIPESTLVSAEQLIAHCNETDESLCRRIITGLLIYGVLETRDHQIQ